MRPELLNPLFAEVEALKGVGPGIAKALARLDLTRAIDLAYHLPTGTIERVRAPAASSALLGRIVVLDVIPVQVRAGSGKAPLRIFARDD
ncbi:MAG: ATP-dependent DNA helicase RecG, partial [Sphingomicrobium sp.]